MKNKYIAPLALLSIVLFGCAPANKGEGKPTPSGDKFVSMSIHTYPKDEYEVGDYFDPTGLKLSVTTSTDVTMTIEYDDPDNKSFITFNPSLDTPLTLEHTKVVVTYEKLTADITITVKEKKTEVETVSYTVDFNAYKFEGNTKEVSTSSKQGAFEAAMTEFVASQTKNESILSSFTPVAYSGIKIDKFDENTGLESFTALHISSGETNGSVTFTFSQKLLKVKVTAQAYFNAYVKTWVDEPYTIYSLDADTTFKIGNESWTLPGATFDEETWEYKDMPTRETKEFEINGYALTLSDDENVGRTFVHKLELTFEVSK